LKKPPYEIRKEQQDDLLLEALGKKQTDPQKEGVVRGVVIDLQSGGKRKKAWNNLETGRKTSPVLKGGCYGHRGKNYGEGLSCVRNRKRVRREKERIEAGILEAQGKSRGVKKYEQKSPWNKIVTRQRILICGRGAAQ